MKSNIYNKHTAVNLFNDNNKYGDLKFYTL